MQITLDTYTMHLEEMPLDIGYASEQVVVNDISGKEYSIGGHNGKTQLIISTPLIDDDFIDELKSVENILETDSDMTASVIVANDIHSSPKFEKLNFYIDKNAEFADMYGMRLIGEPYNHELTKAIILISKDGAIFYDDIPLNLKDKFNIELLYRKIAAAQTCYTGKGCH